MATSAPACARARASERPTRCAPPVIRTSLSLRDIFLVPLFLKPAGRKKFGAQRRVTGVVAPPDGGARHGRRFPYTAHLHTKMVGFNIHSHPVGMQHCLQRIRNLLADAFLYGKAF